MSAAAFPANITIGEKYRPAMEIHDQAEADAYFERCVTHAMSSGKTREQAEALERGNLGYFAGYYGRETQDRVNRLFRTSHPVFGTSTPTAEEAMKAGEQMAVGGGS